MNEDTRWLIESITTKLEITIKRLWILCILLLLSLIISNACWIWYESQWKYVDTTTEIEQEVTQEGSGSNTFIGGDSYGETISEDDNRFNN